MEYNRAEPQSVNKRKSEIGVHLNYLSDSLRQDLGFLAIRQTPCINTFPYIGPKKSVKCDGKACVGNREN